MQGNWFSTGLEAKCDCPAGNLGYCNHIMALLFELADYSLSELKTVPVEIACTSKSRQWDVPSIRQIQIPQSSDDNINQSEQ